MNKHSYPLTPCDNTRAVTGPSFQTPLSHFFLLALTQRYTPYLRPDSLCATCSTTREADSTAADSFAASASSAALLSRARASSAPSSTRYQHHQTLRTLLTDYTKGSRPTTTPRRAGSLFPLARRPVRNLHLRIRGG